METSRNDGAAIEGIPPALASQPGAAVGSRSGRWAKCRRLLVAMGMLLALVTLFHSPLFRLLAGVLVVDDQLVATDVVVVMGKSGPFQSIPFDELVDLHTRGFAREFLLIEDRSSRLVKAGVVPTLETVSRRELAARGFQEEGLTVLAGDYRNAWDYARRLGKWLEEHPTLTVTMLCDEFDSRTMSGVFNRVLGQEAIRIRWHAVTDRRYGVSNWWRSRQGIVQFAGAYITLIHAKLIGEPVEEGERWDPNQYERSLKVTADR